jgi:hypothetical protein
VHCDSPKGTSACRVSQNHLTRESFYWGNTAAAIAHLVSTVMSF